MQRGLGGFPHERLHQEGKRQKLLLLVSMSNTLMRSATFPILIGGITELE
ncbi:MULTISPECIES: hypothetical protein [unclassified Moorena]|nr:MULTISPECIES: hypothetical protein [unclassified Moorena]NEO16268.1 hypothetical protein [Moorena sp. SIO3E8]NEQ02789.1 hypothetical protein [Moorena sp. SIO3F7]